MYMKWTKLWVTNRQQHLTLKALLRVSWSFRKIHFNFVLFCFASTVNHKLITTNIFYSTRNVSPIRPDQLHFFQHQVKCSLENNRGRLLGGIWFVVRDSIHLNFANYHAIVAKRRLLSSESLVDLSEYLHFDVFLISVFAVFCCKWKRFCFNLVAHEKLTAS